MRTLECQPNLRIDGQEREEEQRIKSLPTYTTFATLHAVEDLKTFNTHHTPSPNNGPLNANVEASTLGQSPTNTENVKDKMNLENSTPTLISGSELDFDNCNLSKVIQVLQKMAKDPHTSSLNIAFTRHITNALVKAREEKLRLEVSTPRKLEDGWDPMIKIKININNFMCHDLCDIGASASVMPETL